MKYQFNVEESVTTKVLTWCPSVLSCSGCPRWHLGSPWTRNASWLCVRRLRVVCESTQLTAAWSVSGVCPPADPSCTHKQRLLVINNSLQSPMKCSTLYNYFHFTRAGQNSKLVYGTVFGVMTDPKSVRFTILAHILRGFKLGVFIAMWATGERRAEWYKTLDHWLFN